MFLFPYVEACNLMKLLPLLLRLLRLGLNISLAAIFGYIVVQGVLLLNTTLTVQADASLTVPPRSAADANRLPPLNIVPILNAHLFGQPAPPPPPSLIPETPPATRLNYKLYGIYYTAEIRDARAIIETGNGTAKSYQVGEVLEGQVTLYSIKEREVILKRNDRYETLRLLGTDPNARQEMLPPEPEPPRSNNAAVQSAPPAAIAPQNLPPAQLLGQYQQRLASNPQSLMNLLRAAPVQENGQFIGYRISPAQDRALFEKFGLEKGDIITAVNGITLDNPLKGFKVLEEIAHANQLSLQVNRSGQVMNLQFQIQP